MGYEAMEECLEDLLMCRITEGCAIGRLGRIIDSLEGDAMVEEERRMLYDVYYDIENLVLRRHNEGKAKGGSKHLNAMDHREVRKMLEKIRNRPQDAKSGAAG